MSGWVCLHRKMLEWEWYTDANTMRLFIHLLLRANHKDRKWRGVVVERGSLITSRQSLADELGLGVSQLRVSLKKLIMTGEVTSKTTNKYTCITVLNYDQYQSNDQQNNQQTTSKMTSRITNQSPASNHQMTTNNNVTKKQLNNENHLSPRGDGQVPVIPAQKKPYPPDFEQLWSAAVESYRIAGDPPGSKKEAYAEFRKLRPSIEHVEFMRVALARHAEIRKCAKQSGQSIDPFKHLCRWLKYECYEVEPTTRTEAIRNPFQEADKPRHRAEMI